jgi:hypothetical protein
MICHEPTVDGRPFCRVCGEGARTWIRAMPEYARCERHEKRNPCAIEGCTRSTSAPESGRLFDSGWMCSEHWRRYVPPRSARRRAYNRFWRDAKKRGWTQDSIARFYRFWDTLIASARARDAVGGPDVAEINRIMGWE